MNVNEFGPFWALAQSGPVERSTTDNADCSGAAASTFLGNASAIRNGAQRRRGLKPCRVVLRFRCGRRPALVARSQRTCGYLPQQRIRIIKSIDQALALTSLKKARFSFPQPCPLGECEAGVTSV